LLREIAFHDERERKRPKGGPKDAPAEDVDCRDLLLASAEELAPELRPIRELLDACRDPQACRERLQALVARELSRLRALEETLRVQYEEPSKAEAQVMALARFTQEEMQLLRAEQIHEQSYVRATTALLRARKQSAAARAPAARERDESLLLARQVVVTSEKPTEAVGTQVPNGTGDSDEHLPGTGSARAVVARSRDRAAGGSESLLFCRGVANQAGRPAVARTGGGGRPAPARKPGAGPSRGRDHGPKTERTREDASLW